MLGNSRFSTALVLAPHADDEVLGAGGLIRRLVQSSCAVHVLYMVVDGFRHYGLSEPTTTAERVGEIRAVADILGFSYSILYLDENLTEKLDVVSQRELVDAVESILNRLSPDLLLLPHGTDYDQDHIATFRAGFTAARPIPSALGKHFVRQVMTYEMPKLAWSEAAFLPSLYVDITDTVDAKLAGVRAYRSQLRAPPHIRSLENIERLARLRGCESGVTHAEAYHVLRWVL